MGTVWQTSEHYFQARKFTSNKVMLSVMDAATPMEAAKIGRNPSNELRNDWESIKDEVMREAVAAKFSQHNDLRKLLLSTGDEEIIEASPRDYYWGEGEDGTGRNELGKILMQVRTELREKELQPPPVEPWIFNSMAEPYDFFWSQGEAEQVVVKWNQYFSSLSKEQKQKVIMSDETPTEWKVIMKKLN